MLRNEPVVRRDQILPHLAVSQAAARLENVKITGAAFVEGSVKFDNLTAQALDANGDLEGKNLTASKLTVTGKLIVRGQVDIGDAVVYGNVELMDGTLGSLEVTNYENILNKITCVSIVVHPVCPTLGYQINGRPGQVVASGASEPQMVILRENTRVGDIRFEGNNGCVYVDASSKIMGKVTGGLVYQASPPPILPSQSQPVSVEDPHTPPPDSKRARIS